jgi:hypothetical protein
MPRTRAAISTRTLWLGASRRQFRFSFRPGRPFEQSEQLVRNEAGARRINMAVALDILAMREEALWDHKMEIVPGAGHRPQLRHIHVPPAA